MTPRPVLVTGCYRSGTTVVEKLLHNHPRAIVASQPFPILYFLAKQAFLDARGLDRRYPVDHLFGETGYTAAELAEFLVTHRFDDADLQRFFDVMDGYSEGLWTPEMVQARDRIDPGTFLEVRDALNRFVAELFPKSDPVYVGGKEVLVEEFVPFLVATGTAVVLVVRDPRAVIASLNFRVRDNQTGENRPVLYSLRAWRKSVATVLALRGTPGFTWLRYEDLVADQQGALDALTGALGLDQFPTGTFDDGIDDQWGRPWRGNSSFDDKSGVSATSVRAFEDRLPADVIRYIEAVCHPELRAMGYERITDTGFDRDAVATYRDPFASIHGKFEPDYSSAVARVEAELRRWDLLVADGLAADEPAQAAWFVHPAAYQALRDTVA